MLGSLAKVERNITAQVITNISKNNKNELWGISVYG
jgi:hypothetical protein